MFSLHYSSAFERDVKAFIRHGGNKGRLDDILTLLQSGAPLPDHLRDHVLLGKMRQCRELHVEHDWLLVYRKDGKELIITCIWLVSHRKLREPEKNL